MQAALQPRFILIALTCLVACLHLGTSQSRNSCYNHKREPVKCYTPFVNPAFKLPVEVTNQCGEDEREIFCMQAESTKTARSCGYCDAADEAHAHPASFLTDYHSHDNKTWWQSSTMVKNIQHPNSVNLTINLGKAYIITYIRLTFFSSRPESFAIYKKNGDETEDWVPFQYFSASCEDTYRLSPHELITTENEDRATCREDHSDISPLTGGTVVFSTLEGRPSAYNYENTIPLQEWVTATDIMVSLNRLNTFGDDVFGDKQVLSQYFYGIYDFSIGGRCKCYGHASECVNDGGVLKCLCQHNTDGLDCQRCLPFYNDQPWHRATLQDAHECQPCDCNGRSETCEFDAELYERTGHGGRCTNCREATSGAHCEICQYGFYQPSGADRCIDCYCHPLGSETTQCDNYGVCRCRPGVTGDKCDKCLPGYFGLSDIGCTKCVCDPSGVMEGAGDSCDVISGNCYCKEFVTGQRCDQCKDGFFGLTHSNSVGCTSCFCYGHSSECSLDPDHRITTIKSTFTQGKDGWKGIGRYGEAASLEHLDISHEISLVANDPQAYYFLAPDVYLGDLHRSYGLHLSFKLRLDNNDHPARPSSDDIIIESANGKILTMPIFSQGNPTPSAELQEFHFELGEHRDLQWSNQDFSYYEFIRLLSNVTAIKIRGTYTSQGVGFLSDFALETSTPIHDIQPDANTNLSEDPHSSAVVERCQCPDEYVGQFCEACAPGYRRSQPFSGVFGSCVLCQCNGHTDACEPESGRCLCQHNTKGDNCEFCQDGFYGNALNGTEEDCQPCGCSNGNDCIQLEATGEIVCLNCNDGYGGLDCDQCTEGYYREDDHCLACQCNNNTHPNAIGICDGDTGECFNCHYNTMGSHCQHCFAGYYGNPLDTPHGQCHACECYEPGSLPDEEEEEDGGSGEVRSFMSTCDLVSGQCRCRPNVEGLKCDTCVNGTWNIYSGEGCKDCLCDPMGSVDGNCDVYSGRCTCKKGVTGDKCNKVMPFHYGFSVTGALECLCDPYGSTSTQCDVVTGQCECKEQYRGRKCDQCEMNKFDLQRGCVDCPVCYNMVMEEAAKVREQIESMMSTFKQAQQLPDNFFADNSEYNDLARVLKDHLRELEDSMKGNARADELKWFIEASRELERINTAYSNLTQETSHLPADIANNKAEVKTAKELLEMFKDELTNLTQELGERKVELLEQIKERQRQSGRQSDDLTTVAKQAREIVVDLETKLEEIDEMHKRARNTTSQVIDLHVGWSKALIERDDNILALKNLKALMAEKHKKVREESAVAVERVESLLNVSEVLLEQVQEVEVPSVEHENLNGSMFINMLKEEKAKAEEQHEALDDLKEHFRQLQRNLTFLLSSTSVSLADRKGLDEMANEALNRSMSAWKKVEDVFVEANSILETFKAFDEKIEKSREEAEEAEGKIEGAGENFSREIHEKLHEARVRMEGPGKDVHADDLEYRNVDVHIQIHNRTQELDQLEKKFDEVSNSTDVISEFVSEVDQQLDAVEAELDELEVEDLNETQAIEELREILHKLNTMLSDANAVAAKTNERADTLKHYFDQNLDPLEEEKMRRLSDGIAKLDKPAKEVIEHQLFDTLEADIENLKNVTSDYTEEVRQFELDVQNLEEISRTIPTECFKPISLEPVYKGD